MCAQLCLRWRYNCRYAVEQSFNFYKLFSKPPISKDIVFIFVAVFKSFPFEYFPIHYTWYFVTTFMISTWMGYTCFLIYSRTTWTSVQRIYSSCTELVRERLLSFGAHVRWLVLSHLTHILVSGYFSLRSTLTESRNSHEFSHMGKSCSLTTTLYLFIISLAVTFTLAFPSANQ